MTEANVVKYFKHVTFLLIGLLCCSDIKGMYDYKKADAQKWLNSTYSGRSGFVPVKKDVISAETLLFKGFVRALQLEIGLEKLGIQKLMEISNQPLLEIVPQYK